MLPQTHAVIGIFFAAAVFLLFPSIGILGAAIIFLSSVLIDVDHYIYYVFKKKDFSLFRAYHWYRKNSKKHCSKPKKEKKKIHFGTFFLHGIEILIILFILGNFVSSIFYFILIGFTLHLICDLPVEIIFDNRFDKLSVIYAYLRSKGLTFVDDLD